MTTLIALLRGVNIGGNVLKMERLRSICEELGHARVRTYVQSGNVIFEAKTTAAACCRTLEKRLIGESRLPVTVIVRSPAELKKVVARNPFPEAVSQATVGSRKKASEPAKLYVAFLAAAPTKASLKKLDDIDPGKDRFKVVGNEIYMHYAVGYGNSKISNNLFEKVLSTRATTRNWKTVNTLYEMATAK